MNLQTHILVDPEICDGKACVVDTRSMVSVILDNLAAELTPKELTMYYPSVSLDAIYACIGYVTEFARGRIVRLTA